MENEQKVYGNMQNIFANFSTWGTPFLYPMGTLEISKGGPLQNQNFDVVKFQNKLFQFG